MHYPSPTFLFQLLVEVSSDVDRLLLLIKPNMSIPATCFCVFLSSFCHLADNVFHVALFCLSFFLNYLCAVRYKLRIKSFELTEFPSSNSILNTAEVNLSQPTLSGLTLNIASVFWLHSMNITFGISIRFSEFRMPGL